jgi:hypothetical protein
MLRCGIRLPARQQRQHAAPPSQQHGKGRAKRARRWLACYGAKSEQSLTWVALALTLRRSMPPSAAPAQQRGSATGQAHAGRHATRQSQGRAGKGQGKAKQQRQRRPVASDLCNRAGGAVYICSENSFMRALIQPIASPIIAI